MAIVILKRTSVRAMGVLPQSRGIGSGLLEQAEAYAHMQGAVRITSEVSLTARPFFERKGYRVDREQQIDRGGVLLTNFLMYKTLS